MLEGDVCSNGPSLVSVWFGFFALKPNQTETESCPLLDLLVVLNQMQELGPQCWMKLSSILDAWLTFNKEYDLITILNEVNAWWSLGKFRSIVNAWFEDVKLLEIRGYATIKHYLYALTWKQISS